MSPPSPPPAAPDAPSLRLFGFAFAGFLLIALAVLRPALGGPFISDDIQFIPDNPFVNGHGGSLAEVLVPGSDAHFYAGGSYQPVTHAFHALEWRLFTTDTRGYHVANVLLHALNASLLVLLLVAAAVPSRAALLAGIFFAVHPANVEAVVWISQSRSLLALGFALSALLALERRPLASVPLFCLALLSKSIAAFAIPMAAAFLWSWHCRGTATRRQAGALAVWVAALLAFAPLEMTGLATLKPVEARAYADAATQLRSIVSIGAHYLWMAATGAGTAAFHEPQPVRSGLDPWWLSGVVAAPFFMWRIARGLYLGRLEAAWWLGAAAAYAPVSQVAPFFFPMGDRYLYCILPGLIGGTLLAGQGAIARISARRAGVATRAATALCAVLLALFGLRSNARAMLWQSEEALVREGAQRYPDGMVGHYVAAVDAVAAGQHELAISHLRASMNRGAYVVRSFADDPALAALESNPRFQELVREASGRRIEFARRRGAVDQYSLRSIASGHHLRGEIDDAIATLEEALARGGPLQQELEAYVERLRHERDAQRGEGAGR